MHLKGDKRDEKTRSLSVKPEFKSKPSTPIKHPVSEHIASSSASKDTTSTSVAATTHSAPPPAPPSWRLEPSSSPKKLKLKIQMHGGGGRVTTPDSSYAGSNHNNNLKPPSSQVSLGTFRVHLKLRTKVEMYFLLFYLKGDKRERSQSATPEFERHDKSATPIKHPGSQHTSSTSSSASKDKDTSSSSVTHSAPPSWRLEPSTSPVLKKLKLKRN